MVFKILQIFSYYPIHLITFYLFLWNYLLILKILTETLLRIPFSVIGGTFMISLQNKYSFWDTIPFRKKNEEMSYQHMWWEGQKSRLTSALRRIGNQTITEDVAKRLKNQASIRCDVRGQKIRLTSALRRLGNQTITADVGKRVGKGTRIPSAPWHLLPPKCGVY
jgi:hypothetical protein